MNNKKILVMMCCLLLSIAAMAQTNFRKITYAEALQAAKAEQKQVFVDFYTSWCGPCKMMAKQTFPQKAVGEYMNQHFVSIQIDAEKGEGVELAKRFKVTAYPTFVIIGADDKEVARTLGYRDGTEFIAELERITNPEMTPEKVRARYMNGDRSADAVKNYVSLLREEMTTKRLSQQQYNAKTDSIINIVMSYFDSLNDKQRVAKENDFIYYDYTNNSEQPSGKYYIDNRKKFGDTQEVDSMVRRFFFGTIYKYISYGETYDATKVKALEDGIKKNKADKDGDLAPALKIINKMGGNNKTLFETVSAEFKNLSPTLQAGCISGLCNHFKSADEATKKAAAHVIRQQLPDMSIEVMYSVVYELALLEGRGH